MVLENGQPKEKIQLLKSNKQNHYQWSPLLRTLLQSKGLWKGVVVEVDEHLIQLAVEHFKQQDGGSRSPSTNALVNALAFGDTESQNAELSRVASTPPRLMASGQRRTPPRQQAGAFTPMRRPISELRRNFPFSEARRSRSVEEGINEDEDEEMGEHTSALDKFLKKNAAAMHLIKSSIEDCLKLSSSRPFWQPC